MSGFDTILKLTQKHLAPYERERGFKDFSRQLGWEPSDSFEPEAELKDIINGHLIVEHGLEQSAVITFLKESRLSLQPEQTRKILSISYNNLIDWHIYVESDQVAFIFNRIYNPRPITKNISRTDIESIKSSMFEQIIGDAPNPNFPALDNALVENISYWKRNLAAELNGIPNLSDYSTLFNGLIFVRAAEDHAYKFEKFENNILIKEWEKLSNGEKGATLRAVVERSLKKLVNGSLPKNLIDLDKINVFDDLQTGIVYELIASFYKSKSIPYPYNFAVMSKHALSRIYEHYVSLLRFDEGDPQLYFFQPFPLEQLAKGYGSVYTPQFIARFFTRYLVEKEPPRVFRNMNVIDPACGSGIFLRTFLEFKCTPTFDGLSSEEIESIFSKIHGMDIDPNATQAATLSLSLLYLVLMGGKVPKKLDINTVDALEYIGSRNKLKSLVDVVVANPPYVPFDSQTKEVRKNVSLVLGDLVSKKPDIYLAFIKMAVDILRPNGYGLFVLPHSFLRTNSAEKLRCYIHENTWINCLVDLSKIPVFKDKGSYVILLIFQKKQEKTTIKPNANIIICQDFVGHALHEYLSGRKSENKYYSIFDVDQDSFGDKDWSTALLPPSSSYVVRKLEKFIKLDKLLEVKQGLVTGGDNVFIIDKASIPEKEAEIWKPLLKDRDMLRYSIAKNTNYYVFYPIINDEKLTEEILKENFPNTWYILSQNKKKLPLRKSKDKYWWFPTRLRDPRKLFTPKIITPHLVLLPRFSVDLKGKYAVSRTPYLISKDDTADDNLLKFFLAILNSTVSAWQISNSSDRYSRGYARLEVKTLGSIAVPDPTQVKYSILSQILQLVDIKIGGDKDKGIDNEIDQLVANIYGLNRTERLIVGFQD